MGPSVASVGPAVLDTVFLHVDAAQASRDSCVLSLCLSSCPPWDSPACRDRAAGLGSHVLVACSQDRFCPQLCALLPTPRPTLSLAPALHSPGVAVPCAGTAGFFFYLWVCLGEVTRSCTPVSVSQLRLYLASAPSPCPLPGWWLPQLCGDILFHFQKTIMTCTTGRWSPTQTSGRSSGNSAASSPLGCMMR